MAANAAATIYFFTVVSLELFGLFANNRRYPDQEGNGGKSGSNIHFGYGNLLCGQGRRGREAQQQGYFQVTHGLSPHSLIGQ